MADDRLQRMEDKIDRMSQAIVAMARMEERMITVFKRLDAFDETAFESSYYNGTESFFRHIDVLDIQDDGMPDFVLSGRNRWGIEGKVDIGKCVYINTGSGSFQSLTGNDELMLNQEQLDRNHESEVVRTINFLAANDGELHFLLTQGGNTVMNFIDVRMNVTDYIA